MKDGLLIRCGIVTLLLWFSAENQAIGHQQKIALTDILYNERTGNLEVAHRLSLHDAEHSLYRATGLNADLTTSEEARVAFANYVTDRFKLIHADGEALELTLLGQELERGYLWVYQEAKLPAPIGKAYFIENKILHDVIEEQVNTVNVRFRSKVITFVFEAKSGRKLLAEL